MMQPYKIIDIFVSEAASWQGKPLAAGLVQYIHDLKIAARCMVTKGTEGAYENGEIATSRFEVLSYNLPVRITIVAPAAEAQRILSRVEAMVTDGMVTVQEVEVACHKTSGYLIPKHTRVRDVMTSSPQKVAPETTLDEVARLLLASSFTGLPVVDADDRPVGVVSQGDLIYKADMPMRLGLLAESDRARVSAVLEALASKRVKEVMTQPAVMIDQDRYVTEAVELMLAKEVKRLPVVDGAGRLAGILSRQDIFHTILRECPDWEAFQKQKITVGNLRFVADVMRRDTVTVFPDTPVEEVISRIACNDIQRVAVVDQAGFFLGLISDRDLLAAFAGQHQGIWDYLVSKIPFTERGRLQKELQEHLQARTAREVMNTAIITVQKDAPLNEAIRLMLDKALKRLPVLDAQGKFTGMVSREALLRTGFTAP